ncbi:hypothetical protein MOP88_14120 [Sphingomonas sp. WKB10]|nr:hypothetical protein [Sphingomonas sp. WKB10]
MNWLDHAEHAAGVLCLLVFAGAGIAALGTIAATVVPQWRRILRLAMGRIEVLYPEPQAASDAPHASAFPSTASTRPSPCQPSRASAQVGAIPMPANQSTPEVTRADRDLGEYPIAPMEGVATIFVRQLLLQAMATEYAKATGESIHDMMDAARATWDTDWETDPAPRTIEAAVEAARSDLEHWED